MSFNNTSFDSVSPDNANYVVMIDHAGQKSTHKFSLAEGESIVIGRSWQNDVVINDEFIDSEHLKLTTDDTGTLFIEDLSTTNGTRIGKRTLKTAVTYPKGTQLTLGDTALSVIDVDTSVAPALKRDTVHRLARKYQSIAWYIISTIAAALALVGGTAMFGTDELDSGAIANMFSGAAMAALGVACAGGILSMLFRRNTLFGLHYVFFCWFIVLFAALEIVWEIISFNIDHSTTSSILQNAVHGGFMFIVLYAAISMTTRISRSKKFPITVVLVLTPIIFSYVKASLVPEHEAWSSYADVGSVNQPPMFNFRKPTSVESHLDSTDKLFSGLIKEVHNDALTIDPPETIQISESETH